MRHASAVKGILLCRGCRQLYNRCQCEIKGNATQNKDIYQPQQPPRRVVATIPGGLIYHIPVAER